MRSHIQLMKLSTAFTKSVSVTALATLLCSQLAAQAVTGDTTQPAPAVTQDTIIITRQRTIADSIGVLASGIIQDAATHRPLPGINISVPSFSAAISDENGAFTIKVPSYTTTLQVSAPGFQSKEVPLRGNKSVAVQLFDENFDSYYDQAVTPVGLKQKNQITSSIVSTNTQGGWTRNLETPDNYLQGIASGVSVVRR